MSWGCTGIGVSCRNASRGCFNVKQGEKRRVGAIEQAMVGRGWFHGFGASCRNASRQDSHIGASNLVEWQMFGGENPPTGHESEEVGRMHEKQVNGPQAGGAQPDEAQWDEVEAEEALDGDALGGGDDSDGPDVEKMRRRRLSEFLRDLVRQEGRMEAAELLGVAYRTLVKAEESGELTGRMSDALERLLGTGEDPEAVRLRERMAALEAGMESLAKEMRDGLNEMRAVVGGVKAGANEDGQAQRQDGENGRAEGQAQAQDKVEDKEGAAPVSDRPAPPVVGLRSRKPFAERRLDPEIVTEGPAERRLGGLRRCVAPGGEVAQPAGRASTPRPGACRGS